MFHLISDPETHRKYSIYSQQGSSILNKYISKLKGGSQGKNLFKLFDEAADDTKKESKPSTPDKGISKQDYQQKITQLDSAIKKAQQNSERKLILALMQEKNKLIQSYKPNQEESLEKPRLDCNNEVCQLTSGNNGLVDVITGDCYDGDKLEKLSDGQCYINLENVGIHKMMKESDLPVRSLSGLNFTEGDYIKILGYIEGLPKYGKVTCDKILEDIYQISDILEIKKQEQGDNKQEILELQNKQSHLMNNYESLLETYFSDLTIAIKLYQKFIKSKEKPKLNQINKDRIIAISKVISKLEKDNMQDLIYQVLSYPNTSYSILEYINDDFLWNLDKIQISRYANRNSDQGSDQGSDQVSNQGSSNRELARESNYSSDSDEWGY